MGSAASGYSPEEEDVDDVRDGVEDEEWPGEPDKEDVEDTGGEGEMLGGSVLAAPAEVEGAGSAVWSGGEAAEPTGFAVTVAMFHAGVGGK